MLPGAKQRPPVCHSQQKTTRAIALSITERRDHHGRASKAVNGVRRRQVRLLLDLFRLEHLMQLRSPLIRHIQDVNTAGERSRNNQKTWRFTLISMTRTTGIPAEVMQFIIS